MAKKTVASLHEGSKEGRAYTKVIKMVKSPKTGAYIFDEQMVLNEKVQTFSRNKIVRRKTFDYKVLLSYSGKGIFFVLYPRTFITLLYLCSIMYCTKK